MVIKNLSILVKFVDYQNAGKKLLWYKLLRDGCSTTVAHVLKAIYKSVQICVKYVRYMIVDAR